MPKDSDLVIDDLSGGMDDENSPSSLPDDTCVLMENVETFHTPLGERRRGCETVDLGESGLDAEDGIVHLAVHYPELADVEDAELFAIGATESASVTVARRDVSLWSTITPVDDFSSTFPEVLQIQSQSIHGKWYVMYKSDEDRAHLWDGTTLRRVGLIGTEDAPSVIDTGDPGTFDGDRLYRVRFIEMDEDENIIRRSEPSAEEEFTPSGTNDGAEVTMPTPPGEGETHWELEASDGDGNWYRIAVEEIANDTIEDNEEVAADYAVNGVLSEDIGDYELVPSVRFVTADQDRLIFAGSWTDPLLGSRISWTPVYSAPGVGNDERIPIDTDNFLDLDWMDGGSITGISEPLNGSFYAFKSFRIYKLQRTGRVEAAYESYLLSKSRGALFNSVISGLDEFGRGCVYFLDPSIGPARISGAGIQYLNGIGGTWRHINTGAEEIVCHGVYYPNKQQVHWWVAVDGSETPAYKIVLQVSNIRSTTNGTNRGWSVATGKIAEARCSAIVPEIVFEEDSGSTQITFRPYIGLLADDYIQRSDVGSVDNGQEYRAITRTKPYIVAGLLNKFGGMAGALLADPNPDETKTMDIKFIRDFGRETNFVNTDFVPSSEEESIVLKKFDNLRMSEAFAIQIEFSDPE